MKKTQVCMGIPLLLIGVLLLTLPAIASKLKEGEITGKIERISDEYLRDYTTLDYKGKEEWEKWGEGLKALGWIIVNGESGDFKAPLLLVIDTRTRIESQDGSPALFTDLKPGGRVKASYRMGWDALHSLEVKLLGE